MRQVVLYPGEMAIGWWAVPACPGCVSQGETRQEAIINIKEAVQLCIAVLEEDGMPVPEERFETMVVAV